MWTTLLVMTMCVAATEIMASMYLVKVRSLLHPDDPSIMWIRAGNWSSRLPQLRDAGIGVNELQRRYALQEDQAKDYAYSLAERIKQSQETDEMR